MDSLPKWEISFATGKNMRVMNRRVPPLEKDWTQKTHKCKCKMKGFSYPGLLILS